MPRKRTEPPKETGDKSGELPSFQKLTRRLAEATEELAAASDKESMAIAKTRCDSVMKLLESLYPGELATGRVRSIHIVIRDAMIENIKPLPDVEGNVDA